MRSARLGNVVFLFLLGCGGAVEDPGIQATGGSSSQATGTGGSSGIVPLATGGTGTGGQVYSTYATKGCPDASASPTISQWCDPFADDSGCGEGYGCFPLVRSSEDPCQPAEYAFVCLAAGSAMQADRCDQNNRCASGHVCVVTNTGTMCQRVCSTSDQSSCPAGLFCDPIDVPGVGTCS